MSEGRVRPLFDAMAEDVNWRWMGVKQWTRSFNGKQTVVDTLFGGNAETLSPSSSVEVHQRRDQQLQLALVQEHAQRHDPLLAIPAHGQVQPGRGVDQQPQHGEDATDRQLVSGGYMRDERGFRGRGQTSVS